MKTYLNISLILLSLGTFVGNAQPVRPPDYNGIKPHGATIQLANGLLVQDGLYAFSDTSVILANNYKMRTFLWKGKGNVDFRYVPFRFVEQLTVQPRRTGMSATLGCAILGAVAGFALGKVMQENYKPGRGFSRNSNGKPGKALVVLGVGVGISAGTIIGAIADAARASASRKKVRHLTPEVINSLRPYTISDQIQRANLAQPEAFRALNP